MIFVTQRDRPRIDRDGMHEGRSKKVGLWGIKGFDHGKTREEKLWGPTFGE